MFDLSWFFSLPEYAKKVTFLDLATLAPVNTVEAIFVLFFFFPPNALKAKNSDTFGGNCIIGLPVGSSASDNQRRYAPSGHFNKNRVEDVGKAKVPCFFF